MNWIYILIIVGFVVLSARFREIKHKLIFTILALFVVFTVIFFGGVYFSGDLSLTSFDGIVSAGKLYFAWLLNLFGNVKGITGYVMGQDWGANSTIVVK